MKLEIAIDNLILVCEIDNYTTTPYICKYRANSDWDYYEGTELEFTVESALELDEDGIPYDLSSTEIDKLMADEWFVKLVEKELIKTIEAEKGSEE